MLNASRQAQKGNHMKYPWKRLLGLFSRRLRTKNIKSLRLQVYLLNIVKSQAFARMTLQDKLSSIARLIDIFQTDFGFTPGELGALIQSLKRKLDKDMAEVWDKTYTQYFTRQRTNKQQLLGREP